MDKIGFNKQHILYKEDIQNVINSIDINILDEKNIDNRSYWIIRNFFN